MIDKSHGVKLDAICHYDLEKLRAWRNHPKIWKWCRQHTLITEVEQSHWYERISTDPSIHMYVIHADGTGVGVCGLTSIDHVHKRAEFSCYVAPEKQGNRYATKALRTLFDHGFYDLNLNVIWGETFDGNPARRIFKNQLQMTHEGTRRSFYFVDGKYLDAHLYSVKRSEWGFDADDD